MPAHTAEVQVNATTRQRLYDRCQEIYAEYWRDDSKPMCERRIGYVADAIAWASAADRLTHKAEKAVVGWDKETILREAWDMEAHGISTPGEVKAYLNARFV